ncbi:MAG: hypothetical protein WEE36_08530 [Acidimicrobiia bacterium]
MRRAHIWIAFLVVAAACGGGAGTGETTSSGGTSEPTGAGSRTTLPTGVGFDESFETRPELAEARAGNGGVLPAQESLDLFSAIFGAVPGADPTRFEIDEHDGSMAVMSVLANWDELTTDQQAAVAAVLDGEAPAAASQIVSAGFFSSFSIRSMRALGVSAQVATAQAAIESRLGRALGIPVEVEVRPPDEVVIEGSEVNGYAFPTRDGVFVTSGSAEACTFRLKDTAVYRTVVHELFHCFQFAAVADVGQVLRGQDWITEGSATWVAARIAGVDDYAETRTRQWMTNRGSIFDLDYPALVFYWTIEDMGVDPFSVILGMFGSTGEAAVAATGLDPAAVLPRIAGERAAAHRLAPNLDVSDVWQLSPGDVPGFGLRTPIVVDESTPFENSRTGGPWAPGGLGQVRFGEEGIAHVVVEADAGYVEFEGEGNHPVGGLFDRRFCIRPGGCTCGADEGEEALPMGSENMLMTAINRAGGNIRFLVELEEFDEEFPAGQWEGNFLITTVRFSADGGRVVSDPTSAPFTITVEDGAVTRGSYVQTADQRIDFDDGAYAEGTGAIEGVFTGCAFLPLMVPSMFSFEGIGVRDGMTTPLSFRQPLGPSPGLGPAPWTFTEVTENRVAGTIDNAAYLAFMRSVGLTVDDVEVRFEATRVG